MLVACAGAHEAPPRMPSASDPLIAAAGSEAELRKLMHGSVMNGGIWFEDPECVRQFPVAGKVEGERVQAFAHCLAGLKLQASKRHDTYIDGAVLTYAPGFELEALVLDAVDGPRLVWIGYSGRHDSADALPTISGETLESLRTAGIRNGPVDPAKMAGLEELKRPTKPFAYAWLKVCLDREGTVTSARPREATSLGASDAFSAAAQAWKFKPFLLDEQPLPVCAMARMVYPETADAGIETLPPPASADEIPNVAPQIVEAHRVAGEKLIAPSGSMRVEMQQAGVHRLIGSFKLCIDESGRVSSVKTLRSTGAPSYDMKLRFGIEGWRYTPFLLDGHPRPVCTAVTFIYNQR